LITAVKQETPKVRSRALAMLMRLGAKALPALPAVKEALADEDARVRSHAEEAIRSMEQWR
jgi:HEAT repeat protein